MLNTPPPTSNRVNLSYPFPKIPLPTFDQALAAALGDGPDNGCGYQEKTVEGKKQYFRGCIFDTKEQWSLAMLQNAKLFLNETETEDGGEICTEPLCNDKKLFKCYVCDGPNNICKHEELGVSQACQADEKYCIKELSGEVKSV